MDRSEKLAKLKKRDGSKSNLLVVGNGQDFVEILEATVGELKSSLGNGVEINNLDDLLDQLSVLQSFQKEVKDLRDSIKAIDLPESVKIEGLDELITSIKVIADKKEVKAEKLDTAPFIDISTKVTTLIEKIESMKVPPQGQRPDDYIPTRRVLKVGNKLLYDDSFYTSGGGGGSTNDGIIKGALGGSATVTGGKLDVNATASLAGQAIPSAGATTAVTTQIVDGSGNQITTFGGGTQFADGAARGTATGTVAMVDDGTNIQSLSGDSTGKLNVNNISGTVSLPTGAATSANQTTNNTSINSVDTKTPALGQALAAASTPVVLTAAQVSTLTPPAAISGFATSAKQDTLLTELQLKADLTETQPVSLVSVPSHAVTNAGTFAVQNTAATPTGTNAIGTVGTSANAINVGQQTVNTTAVQISATATVPTNGILVQALAGNAAVLYVGGSGVTTGTGWELSPGQAIAFTCTLNTLYIISVASTTDKICYQVV